MIVIIFLLLLQYREVLLEMFKSSRGLKRKQLIEEITKRHEQCDNKILTAIMKVGNTCTCTLIIINLKLTSLTTIIACCTY